MILYNNIVKETKKIPVYADGLMDGGDVHYMRMRIVGYKIVEFTFDVNPNYKEDRLLLSERTIKTCGANHIALRTTKRTKAA